MLFPWCSASRLQLRSYQQTLRMCRHSLTPLKNRRTTRGRKRSQLLKLFRATDRFAESNSGMAQC